MIAEFDVKGMTCNHCVMSVKKAVKGIAGVSDVEVDLPTGHVKVTFEGTAAVSDMAKAIEEQGYDVVNQ